MQYDALVEEMRAALAEGRVDEADLRRLLRARDPGRPDLPGVLRACGALLVLFGAALMYGLRFPTYSDIVKQTTPFAFPAIALTAAVWLHRARRPVWEVELAGITGYVSLALAFMAAAAAIDDGTPRTHYAVAASLVATIVVLAMHDLVGRVRLTGWGLSASLVAFVTSASDSAGLLSGGSLSWVMAAQAGIGVITGLWFVGRNREAAAAAFGSAAILADVACTAGAAHSNDYGLGPWHAALTVAVVLTLAAAAVYDMRGLMWTGAVGGLLWLSLVTLAIGSSAGWALGIVAGGVGAIGLAAVLGRMRRGRTARTAAPARV